MERTSPEQYGAFVGFRNEFEPKIEVIQNPIFTEERRRNFGRGVLNCHHLWWMGKTHGKNFLRAEFDFQPQMYIPAHKNLHDDCLPVPELSRQTLRVVRAEFEPTGDTFESLDDLLCILNRLETSYKIDPVDKMILPLVEHALEMQIPYLRGNIMPHDYLEQRKQADKNYDDYVRGYK